ncbi:hypothetical protein HG536_0G02030 [Torulaspora globosa]|uniref:Vacuolar protein sorting-associated protein 52 n=1 Tax=Torulaspora globosa TaxID=48254 RepID=A0A7G3ZLF8_9SACH|nr:uncharacterized protein HG536_0G02030 [Torulaspora globosa]QLL34344.1 hypothetical protein HG536_0G02030 [Torulaspora globosa]
MEALENVLGVKFDNLDAFDEASRSWTDSEKAYLANCHDQRFQANNSLWKELDILKEKHKKVQMTLNDVIPPLREYIESFNQQLTDFTSDLGFIRNKSSELKSLLEYNSTKLANVSPLVNDLMLSPSVINDIVHGKVNEPWLDGIAYLKDKQQIYAKYLNSDEIAVPKDFDRLCEVLEYLKAMILEKSRRFVVHQIKLLRSHQPIPSQQIQKKLIEVKEIFQFIVENDHSLALELRQAYAYSMRWYYKAYFARYIRSLTILQFKSIDSQYALGNGLSNTSINRSTTFGISNYLTASYGRSAGTITDESIQEYFQVDKRISLLTQEDNTVMVSQIAENNTMQNYIEIGYKNLNLAILDNCRVELEFVKTFFQLSANEEESLGLVEQIFQNTFNEALEYTRQLIQHTYDLFGVLINIRVTQQLQLESEKHHLTVMKDYLDTQLMILWPKLQQLVDFQCESLRKVPITTSIAKLYGSQEDPLTTPHELTVQFSRFLTSLLKLATTHEKQVDERSEPLYNSIIRIRNDFETVMTKCSKKSKSPERMLATNYMYLYNAIQHMHIHEPDSEPLPLIVKETEDHCKALVEAFSKVT